MMKLNNQIINEENLIKEWSILINRIVIHICKLLTILKASGIVERIVNLFY